MIIPFLKNDLVRFFRGERREMERYIIDAQRDAITHDQKNGLLEFIEWAGKSADRPLAYTSVERTFFREFLYKKALDRPIDEGIEEGSNPRFIEREQMVRLMNLFAEVFFVGHWDPEKGGRRLESQVQAGEKVTEGHLRAWRIAREEVLANVTRWMRLVIANYNAYTGKVIHEDRQLHTRLPDELWERLRNFLESLSRLPCWIDRNLSTTVFGPNEVIQKRIVTIGLLDRSLVHPRDVFADVISDRAASVIFAHNHPSGNLAPSVEDLKTQDQLVQAAEILGIRVLDHLVVGKKGYFSFQDAGRIPENKS